MAQAKTSQYVVSPDQAITLVQDVLRAGLVPMLISSPGVGKSSITHKIANDKNLLLIDLRLSSADPTDLNYAA